MYAYEKHKLRSKKITNVEIQKIDSCKLILRICKLASRFFYFFHIEIKLEILTQVYNINYYFIRSKNKKKHALK